MTEQEKFRSYCNKTIIEYPFLQDEIIEIYKLAMHEVRYGGSETHEIGLAMRDIKELISKKIE